MEGAPRANVVDEANNKSKARMPAIFGEIGSGKQPDRRSATTAIALIEDAAEDGVGQTATLTRAAASSGEQFEIDA